MSLDGKIATRTGASQWITSPAARLAGHRLRHASDALLVGLGTVLQDDPLLTTRLPDRQGVNPLRVIVDSRLRMPARARLATVTSDCRTLVATTASASQEQRQRLADLGLEIVVLPAYDDGRVDLQALLHYFGQRQIASVLVEGGATLNASLLQRRLVDKVVCFIAPKIIGGDGLSVIGACGIEGMEQVIGLRDSSGRSVAEDFLVQAYLA
jgi:diaminohydroxyphosphoribosylaminopyrimidine deaminase/5-amino-6-(5-phosphoribosylamino)uracil reductase